MTKSRKDKNEKHIDLKTRSLEYWIEANSSIVSHKSTIGTDLENVVKDLLREYLPIKFSLETGFVRSLEDIEWQSNQIDILFTLNNTGFPLATLPTCKVFPIEAVLGIMEVTKYLYKTKLEADFAKVSELLHKHKRYALKPISDLIDIYSKMIEDNAIDAKAKESLKQKLDFYNTIKNPRNQRDIFNYNDMPPRFFYFAKSAIKDTNKLLGYIYEFSQKYGIALHGMFILDQRLYISNLGVLYYYDNDYKAFAYFIFQLIDSLVFYGDIPGIIPFDKYFGIDKRMFKRYQILKEPES